MKKKFLLVGLVAMFGFGAFVVSSCSDDDDNTCKVCDQIFTDAQLKEVATEAGLAKMSCDDLKTMISMMGGCDAINM
ncbi:hypothetical protein AGMMS4957_08770 [Bacteroidia bacterium]|nr:hypothetical protein AGMMS4957_08770 [Bacteroidia bacterium]